MRSILSAIFVVLSACSAPATLPDLVAAERRADAGDVDGALAAYRAAQQHCGAAAARAAGEGGVRGRAARRRRGPRARRENAASDRDLPRDPTARGGRRDDLGDRGLPRGRAPAPRGQDRPRRGPRCGRSSPTGPTRPPPRDAVRLAPRRWPRRDPRALADEIAKLVTPLAETAVADNLVWSLADLTEHELGNPAAARAPLRPDPRRLPRQRPARRCALAGRTAVARARRSRGRGRAAARAARHARGRARHRLVLLDLARRRTARARQGPARRPPRPPRRARRVRAGCRSTTRHRSCATTRCSSSRRRYAQAGEHAKARATRSPGWRRRRPTRSTSRAARSCARDGRAALHRRPQALRPARGARGHLARARRPAAGSG